MTDSLAIANEILRQLGGNRFLAMTGARNLVATKAGLQMDLPRNASRANRMTITLDASDLYEVAFERFSRARLSLSSVARHRGVFCDGLRELFTETTGLFTSIRG